MDDIKKLLTVPYCDQNFKKFSIEFLKDVDILSSNEQEPPLSFKNTIKSYSIFGTFIDDANNKILVLSVKVKNYSIAPNAQRNFIAYLLEKVYLDFNAALVAYYDDVRKNWKLSFVTIEYSFTDKGVELNYKPAKRYSFLVGEDEPTRTYFQQLNPIFISNDKPTLNDISNAFSVSRLTNEFYFQYKNKFFELYDYLINNKEFLKVASRANYGKSISKFTTSFCKKTLGQVVFLFFVQKKGWLGVNDVWGDGDKKYLLNSVLLFNGDNYFDDFLEPLFYDGLNKKRENDLFNGKKIPFLNGGLFQPVEDYDWQTTSFNIPNDFWHNEKENGLLDIFSQYNFTVDESSQSEQEIAIDPEMLGRIFESLMSDDNRHNKGAFYTPRDIVSYLCKETLSEKISSILNLDVVSLKSFIEFGDALKETEFISTFADDIDKVVSKLTILDPAVGSGAFLLGMMNEIVSLRINLSKYIKRDNELSKFEYKMNAIQNCLHGVDIEYDAIEIAKLRLWLSLIVDQETKDDSPKPLPNLSFCLRVGNSLVDTYEGIKLWDNNWRIRKTKEKQYDNLTLFQTDAVDTIFQLLKKEKQRYFYLNDKKEKKECSKNIERYQIELIRSRLVAEGKFDVFDKLEEQLKEHTKPFFIWDLEFAEVFENGGFDIIVSNPPYVDSETMIKDNPSYREYLSNKYDTAKGNWDLFIPFIELGYILSNNNASLGYIVKNTLLSSDYSSKIRKYISNFSVAEIRDYSTVRVFKEASVYPVTFIASKQIENHNKIKLTTMDDICSIKNMNIVDKNEFINSNNWNMLFSDSGFVVDAIRRIKNNNVLKDCGFIVKGAASVNEAYEIKNIIGDYTYQKDCLKFINTGTIDPFKSLWGIKDTQYIKDKYKNPTVISSILKEKMPTRYQEACKEKLIVAGMSKTVETFYDKGEYLAGKSTCIIYIDQKHLNDLRLNLKALACILNSNLITFYYQTIYKSSVMAGGYFNIKRVSLEAIPIPKVNTDYNNALSNYCDILSNGFDINVFNEMNSFIYKIYGFSNEESKLIEEKLIEYNTNC